MLADGAEACCICGGSRARSQGIRSKAKRHACSSLSPDTSCSTASECRSGTWAAERRRRSPESPSRPGASILTCPRTRSGLKHAKRTKIAKYSRATETKRDAAKIEQIISFLSIIFQFLVLLGIAIIVIKKKTRAYTEKRL